MIDLSRFLGHIISQVVSFINFVVSLWLRDKVNF